MSTLTPLTPGHRTVLLLLYRYRFLTRRHLQSLLHHTDRTTTKRWLASLYSHNYIGRTHIGSEEHPGPPVYYLRHGIHWLRTYGDAGATTQREFPEAELKKRYADGQRSLRFIRDCLLLADCSLALQAWPTCQTYTEADYRQPQHPYHFLADEDGLPPNLYIVWGARASAPHYLLYLLPLSLPPTYLRSRIKALIRWQAGYGWYGPGDMPVVLLVCPTERWRLTARNYLARARRDASEADTIKIWVTTRTVLARQGITARIWKEGAHYRQLALS